MTREITGTIDGDTRAHPQRLRRAARRRRQPHVLRQGGRRPDVGHARHGRVPGRDVDAPRVARRGEADARATRSIRLAGWSLALPICVIIVIAVAGAASAAARLPRRRQASPSTTCCCAAATSSIPETRSARVRDVAIAGGKIAAVAARIESRGRVQDRRCLRAATSRPASSTSTPTSTPAPASRARTRATTASIPTASRSASA